MKLIATASAVIFVLMIWSSEMSTNFAEEESSMRTVKPNLCATDRRVNGERGNAFRNVAVRQAVISQIFSVDFGD